MPKPLKKRPAKDANEIAFDLVRRSTEAADEPPEPDIPKAQLSAYMAALGRRGGRVSGARRMLMPVEQRREIASKAARAMWAKRKGAKKR